MVAGSFALSILANADQTLRDGARSGLVKVFGYDDEIKD